MAVLETRLWYICRRRVLGIVGLALVASYFLAFHYVYDVGTIRGMVPEKMTMMLRQESYSVNQTWVNKRKELLADSTNPRKVLIFAYMRGGSSIIGQTLGDNQDSFYWYEPLDQFYNDYLGFNVFSIPLHITYTLEGKRRLVEPEEADRIEQFFSDLYSCRLDSLPREMLLHAFMRKCPHTAPLLACEGMEGLRACKALLPSACRGVGNNARDTVAALRYNCSAKIDKMRKQAITEQTTHIGAGEKEDTWRFARHEQCMRRLAADSARCLHGRFNVSACTSKDVLVSKVLRANMETMEGLLQRMPDLHILHYFRDPRAIAISVNNVPLISFLARPDKDVMMTEMEILCRKMAADIAVREGLEKKYPGAFATLSYEELVYEPETTLERVYAFLGRSVPEDVMGRLKSAFYAKNTTEVRFGHTRQNATETANKWREALPRAALSRANHVCARALSQLGYHPTVD